MKKRYITYFRVSTDKQGRSGLGMEAQASAVQAFLDSAGGNVVDTFTEVESGRKDDRPELQRALTRCRLQNASMLVAKLDRLSRSVSMISRLMDSKVRFVCADMPEANELTVHLLAAMAEYESKLIGTRTKAALAEAKKRGVVLGNPRLAEYRPTDTTAARAAKAKKAQDYAGDMREVINDMDAGLSLRQIAAELTRRGFLTPHGKATWYPAQVQRLLKAA